MAEVLKRDAAAAAASNSAYWEVDALPVPIKFDDDENALPVLTIVVADGFVLHSDLVSHAPAEPTDVAQMLAAALRTCVAKAGGYPPQVRVRYRPVADALATELAGDGVNVSEASRLPGVEDARRGLWDGLGLPSTSHVAAMPETWTAWGLPRSAVADLFAAAAEYYRRAPWLHVDNLRPLRARMPDGGRWWISVMGGGGLEYGLVMYASGADVATSMSFNDEASSELGFEDAVLSLTFEGRPDVSKPMLREISRARWEIAGPHAYPVLFAINTPAGGVTASLACKLTDLLRSVPVFADLSQDLLTSQELGTDPPTWTDPETGVQLTYEGPMLSFADFLSPESPSLWLVPTTLTPALPEGPNANPMALLDPEGVKAASEELAVVARFADWLAATGATEATVMKHAKNALAFAECLVAHIGFPFAALSERELRVILYNLYPQLEGISRTQAMAMRTSMRRLFEYLAAEEGIELPWAEAVLSEKSAFEDRWEWRPSENWELNDDDEWSGEALDDLHQRVMFAEAITDDDWPDELGAVEAQLTHDLNRLWMVWRDEIIVSGVTEPEAVRTAAIARQRAWELEPQPELGGETPADAVRLERASLADD